MGVNCVFQQTMSLSSDETRKVKLTNPLYYNNRQAQSVRVVCVNDDGTPADLTGIQCDADFLRADGYTVYCQGTVEDNVAEVVLPQSCYLAVGRFKLTVQLYETDGEPEENAIRSAVCIEGSVERNITDMIVDPGHIIPSIAEVIQKVELCDEATEAANDAADNANAAAEHAVRYDESQDMTDEQKAVARANIDAASSSDIPTGVVRYDEQQTLRVSQQSMVRTNIKAENAVATEITPTEAGCIHTQHLAADSTGRPILWTEGFTDIKCWLAQCNPGDKFTFTGGRYGQYVGGFGFLKVYEDPLSSTGYSVESLYAYTHASTTTNLVSTAPEDANWVYFIQSNTQASNKNVFFVGLSAAARLNTLDTNVSNLQSAIENIEPAVQHVSGTTPSINASSNTIYVCGTVDELSFTPSSGICEVTFVSGSTPTVLTLPNTVHMPEWWTGTEANRAYELSFLDGYGAVMSWTT